MNRRDFSQLLSYKDDSMKLLTLYRKIKHLSEKESEELADYLSRDINKFEDLPTIIRAYKDNSRSKGYRKVKYREKNSKRKGAPIKPKDDKKFKEQNIHTRNEDYIAYDFFNFSHRFYDEKGILREIPELGYILDYQTPIGGNTSFLDDGKRIQDPDIEEKESDYNPGCCDLISYNPKNNTIYILELKDEDSTESLISPVVEAYTYLMLFDKDALCDNMRKIYPNIGIDNKTELVAAPLIYSGGEQHKEYVNPNSINIKDLIKNFGEQVFIYKNEKEIGSITVKRIV